MNKKILILLLSLGISFFAFSKNEGNVLDKKTLKSIEQKGQEENVSSLEITGSTFQNLTNREASKINKLETETIISKKNRYPSSVQKFKKANIKRYKQFKVPKIKIKTVKKRKLKLEEVQPPVSSRLYYSEGSDEAELEEVINEEIKQLFNLLKKKINADLILRLGSLYVDKARLISDKIYIDYDKKYQDFKLGLRATRPNLNLKKAQLYNRKSLKLFKNFRNNYPKHKRMDEVLFFLGFNFYQLEKEKEGIKYFVMLEKRFPKSVYLYESRFQLGEYYFKINDWKNSYKYYNKVSKNKRAKFYFFALYKMAWSSYKMNQTTKALGFLERIIRESREFKVISDTNQIVTFTAEAIEDLVLFYSYSSRTPGQAKSFFINLMLDEKQSWALLKKLAYTYRDIGRLRGVLILFGNLIDHAPVGKEAFEYKYQIVETLYSTGKTSKILRHVKEWVRDYGKNSAWLQTNNRNPTLVRKALNLQEVTIRNYALKNHETFRSTKSNKSKILALNFYKIYFSNYVESKYLDQMLFFYAELLFDSKKYVAAIRSYEEVIVRFSGGKYEKAAYVNQILALEKLLPKEKEINLIVGRGEEPVEFPKAIKSFMKVALRYVKKYPKEKNSASILYKQAALYYNFKQFPLSVTYFKKLSAEYPRFKLVSDVGGILLDIYNRNKDYKALGELAKKLSQNKTLNKEILREVNSVLEQLSFKKAQDLALKKQYKESAILYEKFARENSNSSLALSAYYNAGINYEKHRDSLTALSMYSAVITHKGSKHTEIYKKSLKFLAILYEKLGFYKKAAMAYVNFAKTYPSDSKSLDFWYNSGVIYDALNYTDRAIFSYTKYFSLSKKSERYEIFYLIGLMYEKNKNWTKAIENYSRFLKQASSKKYLVIKTSFMIADFYDKKFNNQKKSKIWHQKTLNSYQRLRVGVSYAARSHFYLTKHIYDQFSQIKIPRNSKGQAVDVGKKIKLLKYLEKSLKPVIRYNDGEQILAALTLIAQANHELAQAIYKAPAPRGLGKKGLAQYKNGIKEVIDPYVKEAVKSYNLVLKKSQQLKVYSEWISKAYQGRASIDMKNGKFRKFLPKPLQQETLDLQLVDSTGTVTENYLKTFTKSLKYGVSREDLVSLVKATSSKKESEVLKAVSKILNKDSKNIIAINSLALFYLKGKYPRLGALIFNRVSSHTNNPVILNNLAVLFLQYGDEREAINLLKKAIATDNSFHIAKVNLATIFIQKYDYINAYKLLKNSYEPVIRSWKRKDKRTTTLLNNYSVSLTGVKKWSHGSFVFKNLTSRFSPRAEFLLNFGIFLTEKSLMDKLDPSERLSNLLQAKELVDEISLYATSARIKRKIKLLTKYMSAVKKELALNSKQKGSLKR